MAETQKEKQARAGTWRIWGIWYTLRISILSKKFLGKTPSRCWSDPRTPSNRHNSTRLGGTEITWWGNPERVRVFLTELASLRVPRNLVKPRIILRLRSRCVRTPKVLKQKEQIVITSDQQTTAPLSSIWRQLIGIYTTGIKKSNWAMDNIILWIVSKQLNPVPQVAYTVI